MQTAIAPPSTNPSVETVGELYEQMVLVRGFETEAERQYKAAKIGGYCHVASGQEAATVGAVHALQKRDTLITGYRCHGFALARGTAPEAVMAELFGRSEGCSGGRGGSMHLIDVAGGFYGEWGIVSGQLPPATGLALALVRQGQEQAVLCELGDGAVNIGAWHEALNLAALWSLPVVFLIVNNGYGRPLDVETVANSVAKTNRAVCVEEGWPSYGVTAELAARIQKACFDDLDAPVERVGMAEVPLPYAENLEAAALPGTDRIEAAILSTVGRAA